jgi:hypothetical protein
MKVLKVFGWIIFLLSLIASFLLITNTFPGISSSDWDWLFFLITFSLAIGFGYLFRKTLLIPFQAFWNLTFERKMMLLVTIAILIAVIFYSWDIWKMHNPKTIRIPIGRIDINKDLGY